MPSFRLAMPSRTALALGMLFSAGLAGAAPSDVSRLLPLSLEELINTPVVTASRRSEARDHTPAHIMVVTRQQIRERRYRNLADLLEDLPGVDFMRGTKSSTFNNFTVQGYNSNNKLLIMLDGVRIDHPAGGKIPVAENFSLFHARQVEVLYGPAAALYGADAVAGVINIITERPAQATRSWVSVGTGRFDSREVSFMASAKAGDEVALSVGGHRQASDRAPLDRYYRADFAKQDAKTFAGGIELPADAREDYVGDVASHSVFARLDFGDGLSIGHYRNFFRQLTSTGDRPDTTLFSRDASWETLTETTYARARFDLATNVRGELLLEHAQQELDPRSKYLNIYTGFRDKGYVYSKSRRAGIEQSVDWTMSEQHAVQAALGFHDYYALQTPDLPRPYDRGAGRGGQEMNYPNTPLPIEILDASYQNRFGYIQLQSDWSEQWSTMVGVRYDSHSAYGESVNPRLGAVWRPQSAHVFKLLYGEAFRAPSPEESLSSFGSFMGATDGAGRYLGAGFRVPNDSLEPEKARTLSLTWDWRPRSNLNLIANVYHSRIRNLIVTLDEQTPTQYIPGAVLSQTTVKGNAGEERHTGLDLIGQVRLNLGSSWQGELWSSLSFVEGDIREGGDAQKWDISYVAPRKAKLGATFRYFDQFSMTPRLVWVDDTTTGRKNRAQPGRRLETPGYAVASLHLGWHRLFDGRASLWLDIDNLFDRRYDAAHGSASTTFVGMPQSPRSWMATLEYRF